MNEPVVLTAAQRAVLPKEAQQLYMDVYMKRWQEYDEAKDGPMCRDAVASISAIAAVTRQYERDEGTIQWHRKSEMNFPFQTADKVSSERGKSSQFIDVLKRAFRRHQAHVS